MGTLTWNGFIKDFYKGKLISCTFLDKYFCTGGREYCKSNKTRKVFSSNFECLKLTLKKDTLHFYFGLMDQAVKALQSGSEGCRLKPRLVLSRRVFTWSIWDKVFKNGPIEICRRQPLKNLNNNGPLKNTISLQIFKRLSSTNFTCSILEYFVPYDVRTQSHALNDKALWK